MKDATEKSPLEPCAICKATKDCSKSNWQICAIAESAHTSTCLELSSSVGAVKAQADACKISPKVTAPIFIAYLTPGKVRKLSVISVDPK